MGKYTGRKISVFLIFRISNGSNKISTSNAKSASSPGSKERSRGIRFQPDLIIDCITKLLGKRPFRVHIDPAQDGAEIVNGVADRIRTEMYRNIGRSDLLTPVIY